MSQEKYNGMDVLQATISVAGMDARGQLLMECLLETRASTIVELILMAFRIGKQNLKERREGSAFLFGIRTPPDSKR